MSDYNKIWKDWFEGGNSIWSEYGYNYHSYLITKHIIQNLNIPKEGHILQFGTGLGITIELLCSIYGVDRVVGYDIFNPLKHPNIQFFDAGKSDLNIDEIAYCDIDIGSVGTHYKERKDLLDYISKNIVKNGYILTSKKLSIDYENDFEIIELNTFDIPELWKNVHESRLYTKVLMRKK